MLYEDGRAATTTTESAIPFLRTTSLLLSPSPTPALKLSPGTVESDTQASQRRVDRVLRRAEIAKVRFLPI